MLGLSYPPFPVGVLAAFALVPYLILSESLEGYGESLRYSYLWLLVVHVLTLYWAGGFTHARDFYLMVAGAALVLVHPLFYAPAVIAFAFVRRHFGFGKAVCVFPFIWVSMEFLLSRGELSFPWLTLANTQTYDLLDIQMASVMGAYGISFWILWMNVVAYFLYSRLSVGSWKSWSRPAVAFAGLLLALFVLPKIFGLWAMPVPGLPQQISSVRIGIIQPNIDPFDKWQQRAEEQLRTLQRLTDEASQHNLDLLIWPETAIPVYLLAPENRRYYEEIRHCVDSLDVRLLSGVPDVTYFVDAENVPKSSRRAADGRRYETYNSSMLFQPHTDVIQKYAKTILVPFAERVPFSEELSFLNAMKWNFGLGGWGFGRDTTVFVCATSAGVQMRFSNLICYESIFPGYVAGFVRKGAEFLTIITNDSWWGNTSGAYQHEQFAILRAIENRRWIARCANGGISCFIDPFGHIVRPTTMYSEATVIADIEPRHDLTFYTRHGDWLAEACLVLTGLFLAAGWGKAVYVLIRRREA